ncbi:hypothetical protein LEMLEM_LOCUS16801 [Lemmus lemmus]
MLGERRSQRNAMEPPEGKDVRRWMETCWSSSHEDCLDFVRIVLTGAAGRHITIPSVSISLCTGQIRVADFW